MRPLFLSLILIFQSHLSWAVPDGLYGTQGWPALKDKHFMVVYPTSSDEPLARDTLRRAEELYNVIADNIGYARYQHFWTWDERVKIILFPDKDSFTKQTGQSSWSEGFAQPYSHFFKARLIVSFRDQPKFLTEVLPHEISHLLLHDFMGFDKPVPLFFDEGVAQLQQERDDATNLGILARLAVQGKMISLSSLLNYPLLSQQDSQETVLFYAESLYIVDFLIKTYGKEQFRELCRNLRDGKAFEEALKLSYFPTIVSLEDMETRWVKYLMTYL